MIASNHMEKSNRKYFEEINYLRGLAIFFIVWTHMALALRKFCNANFNDTPWFIIERIRQVFVGDSTAIFVFISGFLFHAIFYKNFQYKKFLLKKIKNVFLPWVIVTTVTTVIRSFLGEGSLLNYKFIINGLFYNAFWYIPFIMIIFLCSLLYIRFIELDAIKQIILLFISLAISLILGRHNLNPILSMFFWNTFYIFGILCSINYEKMLHFKKNTIIYIIVFSIIYNLCCCKEAEMGWISSWTTLRFPVKFDFITIGKMLLCISLMYIFYFYKTKMHNILSLNYNIKGYKLYKYSGNILNILAKYSFSIFFIHNIIFLYITKNPFECFISRLSSFEVQIFTIILTIVTCIICIFIAFIIKLIFKKYSRMIIGS